MYLVLINHRCLHGNSNYFILLILFDNLLFKQCKVKKNRREKERGYENYPLIPQLIIALGGFEIPSLIG